MLQRVFISQKLCTSCGLYAHTTIQKTYNKAVTHIRLPGGHEASVPPDRVYLRPTRSSNQNHQCPNCTSPFKKEKHRGELP